ncbi:hypothetical protein EMWEY_00034220 [Eimeria maxima]|uniref:Uncharacterized protein n=1 Tax=Eimeria maxima TaxID=5804 RepID=U6MGF2_EIMMA|nr:hypothetical protein EMWEY_00034220 [Eimeria maxima]CDJ60730.1 hypothetical protein EMWEY_00034220 [Eimeria maxima]
MTPADYQEMLLRVEPRHIARPSWEYFDFTGPVCILYSWLATLTWFPEATLTELFEVNDLRLAPVTNLDDSAAL